MATMLGLVALQVRSQSWYPLRDIPLGDHPSNARFTLVMEGDLVVCGISTSNGGRVRVHQRNEGGLDQWGLMAELIGVEPYFGHALALRNGALAIGNPGSAGEGPFTGNVIVARLAPEDLFNPITVQDTLRYGTTADRFGFALAWIGDTLAVSAVGRSLDRIIGEVLLYANSSSGMQLIGPLVVGWQDVQLPFTRWFGTSIAVGGDRLAVSAPYSGTRTNVAQQNLGTLFIFERDPASTSGWALDTAWFDPSTVDPTGCVFDHIELGRSGLGFAGDELFMDHSTSYLGVPGNALMPWQVHDPTVEGCVPCGLRAVEHTSAGWRFDAVHGTTQSADRMADRGWTTAEGDLYVQRYASVTGTWTTDIHRRDEGGPGLWGVAESIPVVEECDGLDAPLSVKDDLLVRLVLNRGTDCDVAPGSVRVRMQLFQR